MLIGSRPRFDGMKKSPIKRSRVIRSSGPRVKRRPRNAELPNQAMEPTYLDARLSSFELREQLQRVMRLPARRN